MLRIALTLSLISVGTLAVASGVDPCDVDSTTSLFDAFRALQNPSIGEPQRAGAAWSFHRTSPAGPLLEGVFCCGGPSSWGTPSAAFGIPLVGPVISPVPGEAQFSGDRAPTHAGVLFHPGNDASTDVYAVFAPERTVVISSMTIRAEVIGNVSDGMFLSAVVERNGVPTTLLAPTLIPYSTVGNSVFNPSFSPLTLQPGDRLWLRGSLNGNPFEDWCNLNVELGLRAGPTQIAPPRPTTVCFEQTARITCLAAGSPLITYHWRRNGAGLEDGGRISGARASTLILSDAQLVDEHTTYDCIVTSPCGGFTSPPAVLDVIGSADMNCDGVVSVGDIAGFVLALTNPVGYATQFPTCQITNADMNCDGQISVGDIGPFVTLLTHG